MDSNSTLPPSPAPVDLAALASQIKHWGRELGFDQVGISDLDLSHASSEHQQWLAAGFHGEMGYMARNGDKRSTPPELVPGTISIISARMNYLPEGADPDAVLNSPELGYVSRYALGRDYHKTLRNRLQKFADRIQENIGQFGYRVFVDSAPVMEKPIAQKAGLGWIGKHTNVLCREAGSWFFLGEIYVSLNLPPDQPVTDHCGSCRACIDICPTQAIIAPYKLDARLCISYLTIELRGSIPEELRPKIGNRIYGCDDCQLVCPWNRFAQMTKEPDFAPRHQLDAPKLVTLFGWSEEEFLKKTEGSPIRRIGYDCWLRNIAVALGNAPKTPEVIAALQARLDYPSEMVREHVNWALARKNKF